MRAICETKGGLGVTKSKYYLRGLALMIMTTATVAEAQNGSSIRANIRGGGGEGKCTFEVVVDGAAEVQIRGDEGNLRTLSGAPARWVRLDCNQPLPANPGDFRFQGVDGRGSQRLVRDPRNNRGTAVVQIEDRQGGSEGYTGDITWRGEGGGGNWDGGGGGGRRPGGGGNWGGGSGGWSGQNGDTFNFRGDGNGFISRRSGPNMRVRDVNVNLARNGFIDIAFQAQDFGGQLAFSGRVTRFGRDSVDAVLNGNRGTRANATIYVDPNGTVQRIEMDGRAQGDDFRLNWRAR
jgi:hypothetical protein